MSRNLGIIGAGRIAEIMASTIAQVEDITLYAIAAREDARAQAFAKKHGFEKAYGSYEELVRDPNVDLVYIATPHSHHYMHAKLCLENGKNVLCEKAFTNNAEEAIELFALAKEKNLLLAEAIWTRYVPARKLIDETLKKDLIGKICTVTCNLSYDIDDKERIVKPELAGGALLDLGVYGINFIVMHMGKEIERVETSVVMTDLGVDGQDSITIFYKDGTMAVSTHSIFGRSDRKGIFVGEKGYIMVENINNPSDINVYNDEDELIYHVDIPEQITGYEYEVIECFETIERGEIECKSMPYDESVYIMQFMDDIRKNWSAK